MRKGRGGREETLGGLVVGGRDGDRVKGRRDGDRVKGEK